MKITKIEAYEILDSRGWPTIECALTLDNGSIVKASVPDGKSTGAHEAVERRDGEDRYEGKGVLSACKIINERIAPQLIGTEPDLIKTDRLLIELDGTKNKSNLGANTTLAVSMVIAKAQALALNLEPYEFISQLCKRTPLIPKVMFNIFNGGAHADNGISFQEFMIMPYLFDSFAQSLEVAVTVYHSLEAVLKEKGYSTTLGDEGGFAPEISTHLPTREHEVFELLMEAITNTGIDAYTIQLCIDVAASQFYDKDTGLYLFNDQELSADALLGVYNELVDVYPLFSIEDGMAEDDWQGWALLTQELGATLQLVGDDIFVTNLDRIKKGIASNVANAVLIKPNQVGTVTEAIAAVMLAQGAGYKTVVSHRSGETIDSFIADFAVGTGAGQFKAGACARGERVAKYNRLAEIERRLNQARTCEGLL